MCDLPGWYGELTVFLSRRQCIAALVLVLTGSLWTLPATAAGDATPIDAALAEKNRKANENCFSCHSEAGYKNPPRTDIDMAKLKDTLMEAAVFGGSNHGHMDCRECHSQGYGDYPHSIYGKNATSPCSECHAAKVLRLEPQFEASVHAKNLKDKFTCTSCHNPHVTLVAPKLHDPRKIVAQDNEGCLNCHDSDLTFLKYAPDAVQGPGKKKRPDIDEIHKWLPNTKLHWEAVRCVECHTAAVAASKMLSHQILDKEKAEKNCVSCHTRESSLNTRLYRHLVKDEQQKYGFTNSIILANTYVIGATRHALLDSIVIGLALLTLSGVVAHGAIRIIFAIRRKRKLK